MARADWRFPDRLERPLDAGTDLFDRPGGPSVDGGVALGAANIGDDAFAGVVNREDGASADEVLTAAVGAVDLKHDAIVGQMTTK
ncbi:MAG: hypothetical protein HKN03_14650 [Acidimicrobiales bacterium]|nr:hypothetical protein [Acidimicrobiales bacterium]